MFKPQSILLFSQNISHFLKIISIYTFVHAKLYIYSFLLILYKLSQDVIKYSVMEPISSNNAVQNFYACTPASL